MIAVVDYKAGNLTSVMKALAAVSGDAVLTDDPGMVSHAERIVLPGVGHFSATSRLDEAGLTSAIRSAIANGKPFLGICVGMQWLLEGSEEAPEQPGLGYFTGRCRRFPQAGEKVPHVGWNSLHTRLTPRATALFEGIDDGENVYFTHSYFVPADIVPRSSANACPTAKTVAAKTSYIQTFAAAIEHKNVMGVQFHPEKSGRTGLKVLENFVRWRC